MLVSRPQELSAKKRPPRQHVAVPNVKSKVPSIDPRFDPMCGEFRADLFKSAYGFLDDAKRDELGELVKRERKMKAGEAKTVVSKEIKSKVAFCVYVEPRTTD